MNEIAMTPKGSRKVGSALLKDNWTRASAVFSAGMFGVMVFLLFNNLITALIDKVMTLDKANAVTNSAVSTANEFTSSFGGFKLSYLITLVLAAFFFMFISPLTLGATRWYHSLAECSNVQVGQIFFYYRGNERLVEALVFELKRLEHHIGTLILSLAPAAVCLGFAASYVDDRSNAHLVMPLNIAGVALIVVGLIFYAMWITRYFLAKYLMVSDRGFEVAEAFKTSVRYMRGMHGKVLRVILSFIPYFLLCAFIAPAVIIVPLFDTTMAACAQDIIDARTPV